MFVYTGRGTTPPSTHVHGTKMGLTKHVFVVHGLIELIFGVINLMTSNGALLPGDTSPPAKSLALLGGNLWSYSIICLGLASLLASFAPDKEQSKLILGIAGMLYNLFMVTSARSRACKGWIFIGNKPGILWHFCAIIIHGTVAFWFLVWIVQTVNYKSNDEERSQEIINEKSKNDI